MAYSTSRTVDIQLDEICRLRMYQDLKPASVKPIYSVLLGVNRYFLKGCSIIKKIKYISGRKKKLFFFPMVFYRRYFVKKWTYATMMSGMKQKFKFQAP